MAFTGWLYKQIHNITSATTLTNYQVKFAVYKTSGTSVDAAIYCNNHCNDDFSDIRFSVDGVTSLSYWIESYTSGVSAVVWVKFPTIDTTTVSIYYGNVSAVNESSGENTFIFFDDFSEPLDITTKWTVTSATSISDGILTTYGNSGATWQYIQTKTTYGLNTAIYTRCRFKGRTASTGSLLGYRTSQGGDLIQAMYYGSSTDSDFRAIKSGGTATGNDTNTTNDTYHIYQIGRSSTPSTELLIDGILATNGSITFSTSLPTVSLSASIESNGGSTSYGVEVDWFIIKNHTSIEPIHGSWDAEYSNEIGFRIYSTPSSGNTPLTTSINISLPTTLTNFSLIYGDGETYTNASQESFTISHTYDRFGTFEIYASGYNGSVFLEQYSSIIVSNQTLTASFTTSQNNNIITFTDTSTGSPDEWYWDFGDGTHSYEQNPIHKYATTGTYTITLYASNQQFNGYTTSTVTISSIVYEHAPLANFKPAILNVITDDIPYTVQFTNLSYPTTGCTYLWNFGDSSTSTSLNPSHAYSTLGVYDVTLTTTNSYGYSTITYNDCIRIHNEAKIFKEKLNVTDLYSTFEIKVFNEFSTYGDKFYKAKIFTEISGHLQGEFPSSPGLDEYCNLSFYENINEYCETIYTSVTDYIKRTVISPIMSTLGFRKMKMKIWEENAHYDDSFNRE